MRYSRYDVRGKFLKNTELPLFKGSMLRGAMGHSLKSTVCAVRVHKFLRNYGVNSQKSVFEMFIGESEYPKVLSFLQKNIEEESDSVRIYELCGSCLRNAQIVGEGSRLNTLDCQVIG